MQFIDSAQITIPTRQRKEKRPRGFLPALKQSIISKGLLHPVVLSFSAEGPKLIAGEGRLLCINELHTDGTPFQCNGLEVPAGNVPYIRVGELDSADVAEAELEENLLRAQLTWQEEVEAKVLIHKLRTEQNPKQTIIDTAREIVSVRSDVGDRGGDPVREERKQISKSILISQHMHNPRVRAAKTLNEGVRIALDDLENSFKVRLLETGAVSSKHRLIKGDLLGILPSLPDGSYDAIIADPPYGVNADDYKTITKVAGEKKHHSGHFYSDDVEYSNLVCDTILREAFRLLRSRGILFMFCDPDNFNRLREAALMQAFSVWRTPLIWHKTGAQSGFAPWGAGGFIRSYEMILFATKGRKTLVTPGGTDVFTVPRVHYSERQHAAEKPVELLCKLIQLSCIPGDTVLDPCCGSGPIFSAASTTNVTATGIEIDPAYHAQSAARLILPVEPKAEPDQ